MNNYSDIIVVVHGIGDQFRNATVRSVANRLATSASLTGGKIDLAIAPQPLGYFYYDPHGPVPSHLVDQLGRLGDRPLKDIGVAEVYWSDIPQELVTDAHTLDEAKAWAGTVVARAKALFDQAKEVHARSAAANPAAPQTIANLVGPDFAQAADTLDEIIDTVRVLENLFAVAEKAGVFTFDLKEVLDMYLGDVQVVAEFEYYRTNIVGRFHKAMENVYAAAVQAGNPEVRLHIVAHSEGTVVSFLGLLQAMSQRRVVPQIGDDERAHVESRPTHPAWLERVAGYMTLGSPIDKHLLLWPHLWEGLDPQRANPLFAGRRIKWHNYYDYGDPVGFKLDTARDWLDAQGLQAFEFTDAHDHGFARYMLPGAAHNEYWNDPDVFEHFISNVVVKNDPKPKPAPVSRRMVSFLSPLIPYGLSFAILLFGTYLLYKQVAEFSHPELEPLEATTLLRSVGIEPTAALDGWPFFRSVLGVAALVAGATLISRVPRMMIKGPKRLLIMAGGFLASCIAYWRILLPESRNEIGAPFAPLGEHAPTLGVLFLALIAGLFGLTSLVGRGAKHTRWFWRGMRPMIAAGAIGIGVIILGRVYYGGAPLTDEENAFIARHAGSDASLVRDQLASAQLERAELNQFFAQGNFDSLAATDHLRRLPDVLPLLESRPPLWPVVLAAAAFLYLWWLSTMIFDLAFVWQRYVRNSVSNDRLHSWYQTKNSAKQKPSDAASMISPA